MTSGPGTAGAVTFDYAVDLPWADPEAVEAAVETAEREGRSVTAAVAAARARRFRTDPDYRAAVREHLADAGVDVLSVTVDADRPWRDLRRWERRFDAAGWLRKVTTPAGARAAAADGAVGVVLNTQDAGRAARGDPAELDRLYGAGVRIFQPTYNRANAWGGGCYDDEDGGLTARGRAAVGRLNDLGAALDVSHLGPTTTREVLAHSTAPVAATHVACAGVAAHPRAKDDETLAALAAGGGYVGVVGVPWFLAPDAGTYSLSAFFEHVAHAVAVAGERRVGVGTDFVHVDAGLPAGYAAAAREAAVAAGFPEGYGEDYGSGLGRMRRYADWPVLRAGLEERFDPGTPRGILGENFLSFWERVREARSDSG